MLNVGFGSAIGALIRYLLTCWWKQRQVDWPFATLFINITGCFILGLLTSHVASHSAAMQFIGIGMMGGYTTFSTFNTEIISMVDERRWKAALVYIGLSYVFGILATVVGFIL